MRTTQIFPYEKWEGKVSKLSKQYKNNKPFPHIFLKNFLYPSSAQKILKQFPKPDDSYWIQYKHFNENKMGKNKLSEFPPAARVVFDQLQSPRFVSWLSRLTGIDNLISDKTLEGGGIQQSERGGFLNVHADFLTHPHKAWIRRCNLLIYFNKGWKASWGGNLELWDKRVTRPVKKYPPLFNCALIFSTGQYSFHGHPDPMKCPEGVTRKSFNIYYYTKASKTSFIHESTDYRARPNDSLGRTTLIWLDKYFLKAYSTLKKQIGFSDEFASKVLGTLFGKKNS